MRNAARTTLRLLESLVRIAQAHARLLYHYEVTVQDAVVAVCIMESSMLNAGLLGGGLNPLHTAFPKVRSLYRFTQKHCKMCDCFEDQLDFTNDCGAFLMK